jgi:hypothetical protein
MTTPATAEIVRHLIAVPFLIIGLAFVRWAPAIAELYAKTFGLIGLKGLQRAYEAPSAKWLVSFFGVLFAGISLYWLIVGTG